MFVLVALADVADNILLVTAVNLEYSCGFSMTLELFKGLRVNLLPQFGLPGVNPGCFLQNTGEGDLHNQQEVLMDVEHQVLEVSVHRCLRVNRGLLISQQMVELTNSYRDDLLLLSTDNRLLKNWVFQDLVSNYRDEVV